MALLKQNFVILGNALLAMAVYGGWAIYANYDPDLSVPLMAGAVQGASAFLSTLVLTLCALWVYRKVGGGVKGIVVGFVCSFILMASFPTLLHLLAGTPHILMTIAPGVGFGGIYIFWFLVLADRRAQRSSDPSSAALVASS